MQLQIQGRNLHVSEQLKTQIEKKIGKLEQHLPALKQAHVELKVENTRRAEQSQVVQITLHSDGQILRGEERAAEIMTAMDAVLEKLYKQIDRYKEKHYHSRTQFAKANALNTTTTGAVIKRKRHFIHALTEAQAIDEMEMLGHSFFLFLDPATNQLNLLYRRDEESCCSNRNLVRY
ncbi:MAG: ribosome-associated translation inhibitor RaiA [Chloroflexi bacterium]|nr:ribosome-associated translation inhibitor RaiA [Chloroflexota bacterium]